jgi:L-aspartate oxidase
VRAATEPGLRLGVLTKAELVQSATRWAQGGVAAVLSEDPDSADLHLADTLKAGAGLCDVDAVRVLVDEGPGRVNELIALGAMFDRDPDGALQLAREGGHSYARVVHAGGAATGAEIERALVDAVRLTAAAVMEHWFAVDLIVEGGRCRGVVAIDPSGARQQVRAAHTLLASGGAGQLFSVTTNPEQSTGDGVAMAVRAGVPVADVEFMQFHPTALHHPQMPRPLLSEALRGHGALLRDANGDRFVDELASRDVVAKAMTARMLEQGTDHLWLDATGLEAFDERFPTIAAAVRAIGLDPTRDWLPIAPAAHYLSGGVVTDLDGATALPGLWACGEVACTGVHGANRLASNSLLEGMVFAPRVTEAIEGGREGPRPTGAMRAVLGGECEIPGQALSLPSLPKTTGSDDPEKLRARLQRTMTAGAGVLRDAASLDATADGLADVARSATDPEVRNLAEAGWALVHAARARQESRGAHSRLDFRHPSPAFLVRLVAQ